MYVSLGPTSEAIVDQILIEMKILKKEEKKHSNVSFFEFAPNLDKEKVGNKKFIVRQPKITEERRNKIKSLLREFLKLKISDNNLEVDSKSNKKNENENVRFKIKIDGTASNWYELLHPYLGKYSTLSFEKNNRKEYRYLTEKESLLFQMGVLTRIFKGNHLEEMNFKEVKKLPDEYWSIWKNTSQCYSELIAYLPLCIQNNIYYLSDYFCSESNSKIKYRHIIHPVLKNISVEILNNCSECCPNVVEICGGGGELALEIANSFPNQMNYYLMEYNEYSLQQAKARILNEMEKESKSNIIPIKTDVTDENDYFIDMEKQHPMPNNSIDLIIGSGALTTQVFENKKIASEVAKKCYELLKPGGKLILAGHNPSLLHNEDFIELGFHVINSYIVGVQSDSFVTEVNNLKITLGAANKQLYILEK